MLVRRCEFWWLHFYNTMGAKNGCDSAARAVMRVLGLGSRHRRSKSSPSRSSADSL